MNDYYFNIYIAVGVDLISVIDDMGFTEEVLMSKNVYRHQTKTERDAVMFKQGVEALSTARMCEAVKVYIIDNSPKAAIEFLEPDDIEEDEDEPIEESLGFGNFLKGKFYNHYPFE